ncbi:MAG: NIPSNAP family protein [Marinicella sp.]
MIIDLRDYTLKPNTRDQFIERCETLIFPEQKRLGATILGTFLDANNPSAIVWLRAMPDMAERKRILTAFYSKGEVWKANRKEVNSWIVDSDNVLLVKPVSEMMTSTAVNSFVVMYTCLRSEPFNIDEELDEASKAIIDVGGHLLVNLVTDPSKNNYPLHPIRTGEFGFVLFASFDPKLYQPIEFTSVEERKLIPTQQSWLR